VEDNVAVVIGAMVIAPLLGPSLAFAFGVALGDHHLMAHALRASVIGLRFNPRRPGGADQSQ
jgi:uncharacterized membrane protein